MALHMPSLRLTHMWRYRNNAVHYLMHSGIVLVAFLFLVHVMLVERMMDFGVQLNERALDVARSSLNHTSPPYDDPTSVRRIEDDSAWYEVSLRHLTLTLSHTRCVAEGATNATHRTHEDDHVAALETDADAARYRFLRRRIGDADMVLLRVFVQEEEKEHALLTRTQAGLLANHTSHTPPSRAAGNVSRSDVHSPTHIIAGSVNHVHQRRDPNGDAGNTNSHNAERSWLEVSDEYSIRCVSAEHVMAYMKRTLPHVHMIWQINAPAHNNAAAAHRAAAAVAVQNETSVFSCTRQNDTHPAVARKAHTSATDANDCAPSSPIDTHTHVSAATTLTGTHIIATNTNTNTDERDAAPLMHWITRRHMRHALTRARWARRAAHDAVECEDEMWPMDGLLNHPVRTVWVKDVGWMLRGDAETRGIAHKKSQEPNTMTASKVTTLVILGEADIDTDDDTNTGKYAADDVRQLYDELAAISHAGSSYVKPERKSYVVQTGDTRTSRPRLNRLMTKLREAYPSYWYVFVASCAVDRVYEWTDSEVASGNEEAARESMSTENRHYWFCMRRDSQLNVMPQRRRILRRVL